MTDAVRELLRRYAAAWEDNDRDGWLATFADDATQEDPVGAPVRQGRAAIGRFWDDAMAGYQSLLIAPRQIIVNGDAAAMVWRITAEMAEGWRVFSGVDVFTVNDVPLIIAARAYWEADGRRFLPRSEAIHHLAIADAWRAATATGAYRRSTIDRSLEEEGFIHCSYGDQVGDTAARYYAGRDDVVLLTIDPTLVPSEIKVEAGFPHIYGPLPADAVIKAAPYAP